MRENRQVAAESRAFADVFDDWPHPILVVDGAGTVVARNPAAIGLIGQLSHTSRPRCCDVLCSESSGRAPADRCVTTAVLERGGPVTGLELALGTRRVEVTAAPLPAGAGVVIDLRVHAEPALGSVGLPLRIATLGSFQLECGGTDLGGEWLDHRPGQLLKYLVCSRGRRVHVDELVEMLWPGSGPQGLISLRQAVHGLRNRLEPGRPKQAPSRFILARPNAYELNTSDVVIDADDFELEAEAALRAAERAIGNEADAQLAHAAQLYRAEFLADEPYCEWALSERDRLRSLAARVLRALAEAHLRAGELPSASSAFQRLADLDPLDLDAQRDLIAVMIRRRRHGDAARRYELVRRQFRATFGQELDFGLSDLVDRASG